jgi:hypothetical protein
LIWAGVNLKDELKSVLKTSAGGSCAVANPKIIERETVKMAGDLILGG